MRRFLIILAVLALACPPLHAQPAALTSLQPGTRIRVAVVQSAQEMISVARTDWVVGSVLQVDSAFLSLDTDGLGQYTVPLGRIRYLEVSTGRRTRTQQTLHSGKRGVIIGGGLALVLTVVGRLASSSPGEDGRMPDYPPTDGCKERDGITDATICPTWKNFAIMTASTGAVGLLVGAARGPGASDRWRPVPLAAPNVALVDGHPALVFTLRR